MSAYVVPRAHIDYLIEAGITLADRGSPLRWVVPYEPLPTDYQRGSWTGPTALETYKKNVRELTEQTATQVGQMLWAENHRSVNHRYDEEPKIEAEEPYTYRERMRRTFNPVHVLSLLAGYEYQSCEHPGWEKSEAKDFCDSLRTEAIRHLPGYDKAPWGLHDGETPPGMAPIQYFEESKYFTRARGIRIISAGGT